ncbi:hypothetical protein B0T11DRAFT_329597 [Plectosphaerella cucumerina]|uniref:Uncharacterized protein n=1 Tax=Plectosphaerella cucumerina TaxID=40658 RepID=A0A8K0X0J9_9PEZI|nr:hypothetical protein B0T11DRAFT_329597 [Plectosphaerella cucumerina]
MEDGNNQQPNQPQQSQQASVEQQAQPASVEQQAQPAQQQAQPAQPAAASDDVTMQPAPQETELTLDAKLAAAVEKANSELWNRPEFKQYALKLVEVLIEAKKKRDPQAGPVEELKSFFLKELQASFHPIRVGLVETGLAACGVYHMIWLGSAALWLSHGTPNSRIPVPRPENKEPYDVHYSLLVLNAKEACDKSGQEWVPFNVRRMQHRAAHSQANTPSTQMERDALILSLEVKAAEEAHKKIGKHPEPKVNPNREELLRLWQFVFAGVPVPVDGPFTVNLPLDMNEGKPRMEYPDDLGIELTLFWMAKKGGMMWTIGLVNVEEKLDLGKVFEIKDDLIQAYHALLTYALRRLSNPSEVVHYDAVLTQYVEHAKNLGFSWDVGNACEEIKENLKNLSEALKRHRENRLLAVSS